MYLIFCLSLLVSLLYNFLLSWRELILDERQIAVQTFQKIQKPIKLETQLGRNIRFNISPYGSASKPVDVYQPNIKGVFTLYEKICTARTLTLVLWPALMQCIPRWSRIIDIPCEYHLKSLKTERLRQALRAMSNVTLRGKMCMHPILPVTVTVKKFKGDAPAMLRKQWHCRLVWTGL